MPEWLGGSFLKPYGIEKEDLWRFYCGMFLRWYRRVKQIQWKAETCEIESDDWDCIFAYFIFCYPCSVTTNRDNAGYFSHF